MAIAVDVNDKIIVTLDCDKELPPEKRTKFFVRPMTVGRLRRFLEKTKDDSALTLTEMLDQLNSFIIGWENFRTSSGDIIKFKTDEQGIGSMENWDYFSMDQLVELFKACMESNKLGTVQLKN